MKRTQLIWRGCLSVLALLVIVAAVLFFYLRSRVNIAGFLGDGQTAAITVPDGFEVTVFAEGLNGPRFLHVGPDGTLYAADRGNGRIVALPDSDGNGVADTTTIFADNLNSPHSLVYRDGSWYVGVPTGVIRLTDSNGDGTADSRETLIDDYPTGGHSTRTVEFLPDGRMVVSVGSSCNVCTEEDPRRATVMVYDDPTGASSASGERIFATGLRNAVGLAIHPETGDLWATNNGRDLMGDNVPPETVYIVADGNDYGWPFCHSGDIVDPDMGFDGACDGVEPPVVAMQAHSAPLGMAFYTDDAFPSTYQNSLFIAFHGSWNRSEPTGYKIVRLAPDSSTVEDFATGWLNDDGTADGRPVDVVVGADGALYVSDDKGGFIYRISYTGS